MPFDEHSRLVWSGCFAATFGGPEAERWSCSLSTGAAVVIGDPDVIPESIVTAVKNFHARAGSAISTFARLDTVKYNKITAGGAGVGGLYADPVTRSSLFARLSGGGGGAVVPPTQVAWKVTLDDGSRNPRARGGFYIPMPAAAVDTNFVATPAAQDALLASVKTFLQEIATQTQQPIVVASSIAGNIPVSRIRVGAVLDTIRSRRTSLAENYVTDDLD